jgi:hypothetical protein
MLGHSTLQTRSSSHRSEAETTLVERRNPVTCRGVLKEIAMSESYICNILFYIGISYNVLLLMTRSLSVGGLCTLETVGDMCSYSLVSV